MMTATMQIHTKILFYYFPIVIIVVVVTSRNSAQNKGVTRIINKYTQRRE
jgi:uncharacterized protein YggT (Ycf19 family)